MVVETPPELVSVQDYDIDMVRDMLSVKDKGKVRIHSCDASLDVFNQPLFMDAARTIREKKAADITVIAGPVIVTREDDFSGLLQLADEGVLRLVYERTVSLLDHSYTVEQDNGLGLYLEYVHGPFELPPRGRQRLNHQRLTGWEWQRKGQVASNQFDSLANLLSKNKEENPDEYEHTPILVTQTRLDEFIQACRDTRTDLTFKSAKQLLGLSIVKDVLL